MDFLLPTLIVFFSLLGLIFIVFLKPEKGSSSEESQEKNFKKRKQQKILAYFKKIQNIPIKELILNFWEKVLRRLRVVILRIDKSLSDKLKQLKSRNFVKEEEKKRIFKPIFSKKTREPKIHKKILEEISNISFDNLDLKEEELRLLKEINNDLKKLDLLKNLARLYLWEKDYHSACWALLQVYYLNDKDKIVYDLLLEIKEKKEGFNQEGQQQINNK